MHYLYQIVPKKEKKKKKKIARKLISFKLLSSLSFAFKGAAGREKN